MTLEPDQIVLAFKRMIARSDSLAATVLKVDSITEFFRDVTVLKIEIPNEVLRRYASSAARSGRSEMKEFTEWRVTGRPSMALDEPYEFVWSPQRNPGLGDAETAARSFVAVTREWAEPPKLTMRTVQVTDWADPDAVA